mmetsp:Transcript_9702/g.26364  ORF Transcript_9702/g.26364 Transcript_9702/m.26364 type:complete len:218 (-) Transcript_9702:1623-2276(-)
MHPGRLPHEVHRIGITTVQMTVIQNPCYARVDILHHVCDRALREVAVIEAKHEHPPLTEPPRKERTPPLVPYGPSPAGHVHDDRTRPHPAPLFPRQVNIQRISRLHPVRHAANHPWAEEVEQHHLREAWHQEGCEQQQSEELDQPLERREEVRVEPDRELRNEYKVAEPLPPGPWRCQHSRARNCVRLQRVLATIERREPPVHELVAQSPELLGVGR